MIKRSTRNSSVHAPSREQRHCNDSHPLHGQTTNAKLWGEEGSFLVLLGLGLFDLALDVGLEPDDLRKRLSVEALLELLQELRIARVVEHLLHSRRPVVLDALEHRAHAGVQQSRHEVFDFLRPDESKLDEALSHLAELLLSHLGEVQVHSESRGREGLPPDLVILGVKQSVERGNRETACKSKQLENIKTSPSE